MGWNQLFNLSNMSCYTHLWLSRCKCYSQMGSAKFTHFYGINVPCVSSLVLLVHVRLWFWVSNVTIYVHYGWHFTLSLHFFGCMWWKIGKSNRVLIFAWLPLWSRRWRLHSRSLQHVNAKDISFCSYSLHSLFWYSWIISILYYNIGIFLYRRAEFWSYQWCWWRQCIYFDVLRIFRLLRKPRYFENTILGSIYWERDRGTLDYWDFHLNLECLISIYGILQNLQVSFDIKFQKIF